MVIRLPRRGAGLLPAAAAACVAFLGLVVRADAQVAHPVHRAFGAGHLARFAPGETRLFSLPDAHGAMPWSLSLGLVALERDGQRLDVGAPALRPLGARVERAYGPAVEWWRTEGRGLRQGFDLAERPEGNGPLVLVLSVGGSLEPVVDDDGRGAALRDDAGRVVLAYRGLAAWDAGRRDLPAWMEHDAASGELRLVVDDRWAIYPVTVDPLVTDEIAVVNAATDPGGGDQFGRRCAVDGDTMVAGAPNYDQPGESNRGAAYVFDRDQGGADAWGEVAQLLAPDPEPNDKFGYDVSVAGDVAAVGAPFDDDLGTSTGAVYLYGRDVGGPDNWGFLKKLLPTFGDQNDQFGFSVALDGDVLAVGTPRDQSGRVFLHGKDVGGVDNWGLIKEISGATASGGDRFGYDVALSGDLLAVGAINDDDVVKNAGAVYVFERDLGGADNWGERAKRTAPDSQASDLLGFSVDISATTLVAGAPRADDFGSNSGRAYLFERDLGGSDNWGLFKTVFDVSPDAGEQFGEAVAVDGDALLVGSPRDDSFLNDAGAVQTYARDQGGTGNWGFVSQLTGGTGTITSGDRFGTSTALDGTTLAVGALKAPNPNNSGSVFMYFIDVGTPVPTSTARVSLFDDANVNIPVGVGGDTRRVEWVDLDANGSVDLFELNYLGPEGNVAHFDDGLGVFTTRTVLTERTNALFGVVDAFAPFDGGTDALPAKGVAFGDWDNDGDVDAYVGTGPTGGVQNPNWFLLNDSIGLGSAGVFSVHDPVTGVDADADHTYDAEFTDLNGDGFLDLVVANRNQGNRLYLNEGDDTLGVFRSVADAGSSPVAAISAMSPTNPLADPLDAMGSRAVEVGDLDGDGDDDVFLANANNGAQANQVFVNQGGSQAGTPGDTAALAGDDAVTSGGASYGLALGDLDNDGDLDAFVCNRNEVNFVLRNETTPGSDPSFTRIVGTAVDLDQDGFLGAPVYGDSYDAAIADLDDDGDADIAVVNRVQRNMIYLAQTSAPTLLDVPADAYARVTEGPLQLDRGNTRSIDVADVDDYGNLGRPGLLEVALGNSGAGSNRFFQNHGRHIEPLSGRTQGGDFDPVMYAEGVLSAAGSVTFKVLCGQPNSAGVLWIGFAAADVAFNDGVLVPTMDGMVNFVTDVNGDADVVVSGAAIPPMSEGIPVWFQAQTADAGMTGQPDGAFALSNAIVIIVE